MNEGRKLTTEDVAGSAHGQATHAIAYPEPEKNLHAGEAPASASELTPLFSEQEERDFRARWKDIQTGFVDEPGRSVEQADELVA